MGLTKFIDYIILYIRPSFEVVGKLGQIRAPAAKRKWGDSGKRANYSLVCLAKYLANPNKQGHYPPFRTLILSLGEALINEIKTLRALC